MFKACLGPLLGLYIYQSFDHRMALGGSYSYETHLLMRKVEQLAQGHKLGSGRTRKELKIG